MFDYIPFPIVTAVTETINDFFLRIVLTFYGRFHRRTDEISTSEFLCLLCKERIKLFAVNLRPFCTCLYKLHLLFPCAERGQPEREADLLPHYSPAPHNDVSVNDGRHILATALQLPTVFSTVTCCTGF